VSKLQNAKPGTSQARIIDHRKEANPYESKFGSDWGEPIDKSVTLSQYVCITDMVEHIFVESAKLFKGTKHEHDWSFYHDALSLMTANDTIQLKDKGYYKHWVLPVNGLQWGDLIAYEGRPIGDTPRPNVCAGTAL
jgi:hypothetical protein